MRPRYWLAACCVGAILIGAGVPLLSGGESKPDQPSAKLPRRPKTVDDLRAIQDRVKKLVDKLHKSTVGVRIGRAQGSGVIVSKDGYVLTAAHVSGQPGRRVEFVLADGTTLRGKSLGANRGVDAGMMKIETQEDLPFLEMGSVDDLEVGDWCIAVGHPGGYKRGRTPPVRLGRIVRLQDNVIQTDCTLVGGDSGGPLFDLEGRVIAIHSRIGTSTAWNFHVPISLYRSGWDQLVASETWGGTPRRGGPVLGVNGEDHEKGALITGVPDGFPAKEAGIQPDDIITKVDGKSIKGFPGLSGALSKKKPGDEVELEILRGEETLTKRVKLGARR